MVTDKINWDWAGKEQKRPGCLVWKGWSALSIARDDGQDGLTGKHPAFTRVSENGKKASGRNLPMACQVHSVSPMEARSVHFYLEMF